MIVRQASIDALCEQDPVLQQIVDDRGQPPGWQRSASLTSIIQIILEQQVSLDSAKATYTRLAQYVGEVTPANLLPLTPAEWRACAVSRQKARYITKLCSQVQNGTFDLDLLKDMNDQAATAYLTQLLGVGP